MAKCRKPGCKDNSVVGHLGYCEEHDEETRGYLPTPEQIRTEAALIRAERTEAELEKNSTAGLGVFNDRRYSIKSPTKLSFPRR